MDRTLLLDASVEAARSLRANLHTLPALDGTLRTVLAAGRNQFHSVWTRDFCFAAGGLLAAGEEAAVRDTLDEIIARQRPDGLMPRVLDSHFSGMHMLRAVLKGRVPLSSPLVANFRSDHGTLSIDSNALVVQAAARCALHTGNLAWAGLVLPALEKAMEWYEGRLRDGFIRQPPFSDWKDTVSVRRGAVFFTQLLYWRAMGSLEDLYRALGRRRASEEWKARARAFRRRALKAFWNGEEGFFADTLRRRRLSSESNLAAAAWNFADNEQAARIVRAMDRKGLWTPWGPRAGERYPLSGKGWLALLAGIPGYHDDCLWLWNTALALRVLDKLGRRSMLERMTADILVLLRRQGGVSEVYRPADGVPVKTWLYRSEQPFSWSAGMLLETFKDLATTTRGPETSGREAVAGGSQ